MKRRSFLQAFGAIAATSSLPPWLRPLPSADADLWAAIESLKRGMRAVRVEDVYVVVMHPQQIEDLKHHEARWRWQAAWQRYREAIRNGAAQPGWHPRDVLNFFGSGPQWEEGTVFEVVKPLSFNRILGK